MIKIKFPEYMIDENDNLQSDGIDVIIEIEHQDKIFSIIKEVGHIAPNTAKDWIDEKKKIKKNLIIVLNDKIINKQKIDDCVVRDGDILEILTQFAGG